jgi:hypothetical protein
MSVIVRFCGPRWTPNLTVAPFPLHEEIFAHKVRNYTKIATIFLRRENVEDDRDTGSGHGFRRTSLPHRGHWM